MCLFQCVRNLFLNAWMMFLFLTAILQYVKKQLLPPYKEFSSLAKAQGWARSYPNKAAVIGVFEKKDNPAFEVFTDIGKKWPPQNLILIFLFDFPISFFSNFFFINFPFKTSKVIKNQTDLFKFARSISSFIFIPFRHAPNIHKKNRNFPFFPFCFIS